MQVLKDIHVFELNGYLMNDNFHLLDNVFGGSVGLHVILPRRTQIKAAWEGLFCGICQILAFTQFVRRICTRHTQQKCKVLQVLN